MDTLLLLDNVFYDINEIQLIEVLFCTSMSLLIFFLLDSSMTDRVMLKSPAVIMDSCITHCSFIRFCDTYFNVLFLGACTISTVCLLGELCLFYCVILPLTQLEKYSFLFGHITLS